MRPRRRRGSAGLGGERSGITSARFHRVTTFPDHGADGSAEHI